MLFPIRWSAINGITNHADGLDGFSGNMSNTTRPLHFHAFLYMSKIDYFLYF